MSSTIISASVILLSSFLLVLVSPTIAKHLSRLGDRSSGEPLPDYDCAGKEPGYYSHPSRCSLYVLCTDTQSAFEMECAEGTDESGVTHRLHFVQESGPNPSTAKCDFPTLAGCEPEPTTTTPAPKTCDLNCQLEGKCRNYTKCEPDIVNATTGPGHLVDFTCGDDLFWNPENSPIHGGTCDYYDSLSDAIKNEYRNDPNCIKPCEWFQTPAQKCSPKYTYRKEFTGSTENREIVLSCPSPPAGKDKLFWSNDDRLTCVKCSDAVREGTTKCSCN